MTPKFYWHLHHEVLCEALTEPVENRIAYIKENKPEEEIATRLRLIKRVKGKLPGYFVEAHKAWVEAHKAWDEAYKACDEASKACDEAYSKALPELEKLHKKECKNCPWDGKTIFPKK